jgi:cytochrome P450
MDRCRERFGDTFTVRFPGIGPFVFFSRPDHIKEIFAADPNVLRTGVANVMMAPLVGSTSMLILDGPEHLRKRRLLMPSFQGDRMHAYAAEIHEATLRSLASWPRERPFSIQPFFQEIMLQVILKTIFGIADASGMERIGAAVLRQQERFATRFSLLRTLVLKHLSPSMLARQMREMRSVTDGELRRQIAERREAADIAARHDILSLLLRTVDEEGRPMTDEEIGNELVTLLILGHDTTAISLAWAVHLVLANPAVLAKVEAELDALGGFAPSQHGRLPYLDAVVKESLRLHPVIPIAVRIAKEHTRIAGVDIPPGVRVAPCIYLTHHRPDIYPEPRRFRPERFLDTKPDPTAWLPFGGGSRRCIGIHFTLLEMKLVLATLFASGRLRLAPGRPARVSRRGVLLVPSNGTRVLFDDRRTRAVA